MHQTYVGERSLMRISTLIVAVACVTHVRAVAAQRVGPVDARLTSALMWRNLGPFRAGRVGAVAGAIGQPGVYYAGYPGGGLWKTTNAGVTWVPVFDAIREVSSVGAVEVAPSDPNIVYVGTGDMITGGTLDQGNGVYKSTDAGATWKSIGLQGTRHIQTMLVDPRSPDVVMVGAEGDHVALSDQRGVFRSTDGGRTWTKTLYIDNQIGIMKLARAYDVPDVIFATSGRHYAPPSQAPRGYRTWSLSVSARGDTGRTGTALYKSTDNGVTWKEMTTLPRMDGRTSIAVAIGTNAQRVFVINNSALFRSDDGGTTWSQMAADDDRIHNGQGGYSAGVYVNTKNPDIVYTLNTSTYKSIDGGKTFTGMKGAPGGDDPQQMWLDPLNADRLFLGYDQGATISLDGGATWSSWYNQSTEQLYHLSADNSFPSWIYATQQDAGAIRTRVRGNYGAITMFDWNSVNGWEWGTIVPDPLDPNTVFASGSGIIRISYPSEQWINVSPTIDPAAKATTTSSQPLLFAPWNPHQLLAAFNYVVTTLDGGAHWKRISPDLGVPPGMDSTAASNTLGGRGAIESMGASPVGTGTVWVGTNNGLIHVTRDGGKSWRDVSIKELPNPRRANISAIDPSPRVAGTAYVAVEYLRSGDHTPYLYRTRDFGNTWTKIVAGLPTNEPSGSFMRVVRADPKQAGLLFAGSESGVYVSFNDGDAWQSLSNNLPNTPVRDMLIKGNDLVIATHGRGAWMLDDISMLRQLAPANSGEPLHLFASGTATRVRRNVNADTPFPPEIPHALNPLDGVIIDYWLGTASPGAITLDVLDSKGAVVRHYASDAIAPVPEAAKPPHPNFWVVVPQGLPTSVGAHRVNWDLRADAPHVFTHSFEINANPALTPASPEGALVLPGVYTIRLTANGRTVSTSVTVRNDPRSTASLAALSSQHALTSRISAAIHASWSDHTQVESMRATVASLASAQLPSDMAAAIATLRAAIDSAVGGTGSRGGRGGPPGAAVPARPTFGGVNDALASQLTAQDNGDFAPNAGMYAAFSATCKQLVIAHDAWQRVLTHDLPVFNAILVKAGRVAIDTPKMTVVPACSATGA